MNPTTAALQYSISFDEAPAREASSRMQKSLEAMENIVQSIGEAAITVKQKAMGAAGAVASFFESVFDKLQQLAKALLGGVTTVADKFYQTMLDIEPVWFRIRTQAQAYMRSLLEVTGEQKRQLDGLNKQLSTWEKISAKAKEHKELIKDTIIGAAPVALGIKGAIEENRASRFFVEGPALTKEQVRAINQRSKEDLGLGSLGFKKEERLQAYLEFQKSGIALDKWNDLLRLSSYQAYTTGQDIKTVASAMSELYLATGQSYTAVNKFVGQTQDLPRVLKTSAAAFNESQTAAIELGKGLGITGTALSKFAGETAIVESSFKAAGVSGFDQFFKDALGQISLGAYQLGKGPVGTLLAASGLRGVQDIQKLQAQVKQGDVAAATRKIEAGLQTLLSRPGATPELISLQTGIDQHALEAYKVHLDEIRAIQERAMGVELKAVGKEPYKTSLKHLEDLWNETTSTRDIIFGKLTQGFQELIIDPISNHMQNMVDTTHSFNEWLLQAGPPKTIVESGIAAIVAWKLALKPILKFGLKGGISALGRTIVRNSTGGWKFVGHALQAMAEPYKYLIHTLRSHPSTAGLGNWIAKQGARFGMGASGKLGMLGTAVKGLKWVGEKVAAPVAVVHDTWTTMKSLTKQNIGEELVEMFQGDALTAMKKGQIKLIKALEDTWLFDFTGWFKDKTGKGLLTRAFADAGKTYAEWWISFTELGGKSFNNLAQGILGITLKVLGVIKKILPDSVFHQLFPTYEQTVKDYSAKAASTISPPKAKSIPRKVSPGKLMPGSPAWDAYTQRHGHIPDITRRAEAPATTPNAGASLSGNKDLIPNSPAWRARQVRTMGIPSGQELLPTDMNTASGRKGKADRGGIEGMIAKAVKVAGIDQYASYFHAIIERESSLNPNAPDRYEPKIHDRSVGPAQVLLKTGAGLGYSEEQLRDPQTNLIAGARYFAKLLGENRGDVNAAITAYNGSGPAARRYAQEVMRAAGVAAEKQTMGVTSSTSAPVIAAQTPTTPVVATAAVKPPPLEGGYGTPASTQAPLPTQEAPVVHVEQDRVIEKLEEIRQALLQANQVKRTSAQQDSYGRRLTSFAN